MEKSFMKKHLMKIFYENQLEKNHLMKKSIREKHLMKIYENQLEKNN